MSADVAETLADLRRQVAVHHEDIYNTGGRVDRVHGASSSAHERIDDLQAVMDGHLDHLEKKVLDKVKDLQEQVDIMRRQVNAHQVALWSDDGRVRQLIDKATWEPLRETRPEPPTPDPRVRALAIDINNVAARVGNRCYKQPLLESDRRISSRELHRILTCARDIVTIASQEAP